MENIFFQYLAWQFFDTPKAILQAWQNFLKFNLNYFSISLLFRTLFYPWRRYAMSYGKGFDISRYLEAFATNLIFRIFGAVIRLFLIIIGLAVELFIILVGLIIFLITLFLPFLLIAGLYYGFRILF